MDEVKKLNDVSNFLFMNKTKASNIQIQNFSIAR